MTYYKIKIIKRNRKKMKSVINELIIKIYTGLIICCINIIIIIIIIMSSYQHEYPWSSLTNPPYRPLLPAGLQGYIPYWHKAAVCRFELIVLPLLGHVNGSTGVHYLWARPYFSSSVPHVSSSYRAGSTDIPDPLSPLLPIVHRPR